MITFPIRFEFAGVQLTATVWKVTKTANNQLTMYQVYEMTPRFDLVPQHWMFIHNPEKEQLEFELPSPELLGMAGNIIDAIKNECGKRRIEYV